MTDELFTEPMPTAEPLPPRQDTAMRLVIRHQPDGVTADEVGARVHEDRGKHPADQRCEWCGRDGAAVLNALIRKKLVTRRRATGLYTLPGPQRRALPATFGDFPEDF